MNPDRVLAILVPMLGRPHRVVPLLDTIHMTTPDARVLFCVTPGDVEVVAELNRVGAEHIDVSYRSRGDYARKINAGYRHTTEPLLFTAADDLYFHPGWFEAACAQLSPDIGVVGTNDMGSPRVIAGAHSTHSLVTRRYADVYGTVDGPGEILHEGYVHEYCDDELVATAKHRNAWAFAVDSRVEHLHPNWKPEIPTDALYAQQQTRMRQSYPIFRARQHLWT